MHLSSIEDIVVSGATSLPNDVDKIIKLLRIDIIIIIGYNIKYIKEIMAKTSNLKDITHVILIIPGNINNKIQCNSLSDKLQIITFEDNIKRIGEKLQIITNGKLIKPLKKDNLISLITKRESDILNLIKKGKQTKEIASELFISQKTVENHRNNILKKTKAKSMLSLINELHKLGFFDF